MTWPLRFRSDSEPWRNAQVGDCWYHPNWDREDAPYPTIRQHFMDYQASRQYREQWADKRPPVIVQLPPGFPFTPDEAYGRPENTARDGWTVSGSIEEGTLTVSPSVNVVGTYHGFIQDGQISDDVEGRTFVEQAA